MPILKTLRECAEWLSITLRGLCILVLALAVGLLCAAAFVALKLMYLIDGTMPVPTVGDMLAEIIREWANA